jgi:hypothetical protein
MSSTSTCLTQLDHELHLNMPNSTLLWASPQYAWLNSTMSSTFGMFSSTQPLASPSTCLPQLDHEIHLQSSTIRPWSPLSTCLAQLHHPGHVELSTFFTTSSMWSYFKLSHFTFFNKWKKILTFWEGGSSILLYPFNNSMQTNTYAVYLIIIN